MNKENGISIVEDLEPENLDTVKIACPKCHAEIRAKAEDKENIVCFCCDRKIRVKDRADDLKADVIQETLCLPKGSIRASVALLLSLACWILVFQGRHVPSYIFNLLVAVISYYFAFRRSSSLSNSGESAIQTLSEKTDEFSDVTASGKPKPLYLPAGFIRYSLILGFAVSAVVGLKQNFFNDYAFREFFVIFAGLIAGYFFAKIANTFKKDVSTYNSITHIKGVCVLMAALGIAILLLSGFKLPMLVIICSCMITFYFGSKS